jgi:hypothetical protein
MITNLFDHEKALPGTIDRRQSLNMNDCSARSFQHVKRPFTYSEITTVSNYYSITIISDPWLTTQLIKKEWWDYYLPKRAHKYIPYTPFDVALLQLDQYPPITIQAPQVISSSWTISSIHTHQGNMIAITLVWIWKTSLSILVFLHACSIRIL